MKLLRPALFLMLMSGMAFSIYVFLREKESPPFSCTLSPLFQELGKPIHSMDRAVTKLMPIDDVDEKLLGESIKKKFNERSLVHREDKETQAYLQSLIDNLTMETHKNFQYSAYVIQGAPNAFALPGGLICVTDELLTMLSNEAELVSILCHEIGHIERGHLFDAARGEMLRRKINRASITEYAVDTIRFFGSFFFNKTQENEADEYAFRMLVKNGYDPYAGCTAFEKLLQFEPKNSGVTDPFTDFFSSHPYTQLRADKFRSQAERWRKNNPDVKVYIGKLNLEKKKSRYDVPFSEEFSKSESSKAFTN